jgi:hypothetical protein
VKFRESDRSGDPNNSSSKETEYHVIKSYDRSDPTDMHTMGYPGYGQCVNSIDCFQTNLLE